MQLRRRVDRHHRGHAGCDADGLGTIASRRRDAGETWQRPPDIAGPFDGQPASVDLHRGRTGQNPPGGGGPAGGPTPTPAPFSTGIFGEKPQIVGPIVGVKLDKHTKALRKWRDKEYYDEWRFVAGDADNDVMQDPANKPPVFIPTPRK